MGGKSSKSSKFVTNQHGQKIAVSDILKEQEDVTQHESIVRDRLFESTIVNFNKIDLGIDRDAFKNRVKEVRSIQRERERKREEERMNTLFLLFIYFLCMHIYFSCTKPEVVVPKVMSKMQKTLSRFSTFLFARIRLKFTVMQKTKMAPMLDRIDIT